MWSPPNRKVTLQIANKTKHIYSKREKQDSSLPGAEPHGPQELGPGAPSEAAVFTKPQVRGRGGSDIDLNPQPLECKC